LRDEDVDLSMPFIYLNSVCHLEEATEETVMVNKTWEVRFIKKLGENFTATSSCLSDPYYDLVFIVSLAGASIGP
jgi:hypothetical protein